MNDVMELTAEADKLFGNEQEQRSFVVRMLKFLAENRADEIEANLDSESLLRTLAIWSGAND